MSDSPLSLHSLAGQQPSEDLVTAWRLLADLGVTGIGELWQALEPMFVGATEEDCIASARTFCNRRSLAAEMFDRIHGGYRFLVQRAVARDLSADEFAEDVAALTGGDTQIVGAVLEFSAIVRDLLRQEILTSTLFEHGRVLTGLDWRVDRIVASHSGLGLDFPVALLSLRTQTAGDQPEERSTIHVTREVLAELREACDRIAEVLGSAP